jgi:hypothetical protein
MTDIKQCWAYNKQGNRCEHPAGHNGNHIIEQTWTDEECAAPTQSAPATSNLIQVSAPVTQVLQEEIIKCVACNHAHKNGECKCGCHEFIG